MNWVIYLGEEIARCFLVEVFALLSRGIHHELLYSLYAEDQRLVCLAFHCDNLHIRIVVSDFGGKITARLLRGSSYLCG